MLVKMSRKSQDLLSCNILMLIFTINLAIIITATEDKYAKY